MILDRIFEHLKPQQGVIYLKEARRRVLPGRQPRAARAVDRHPALAHAGARGARQGHGRAGVRRRHRPALRRLREHHDVGHPLDGGGAAPRRRQKPIGMIVLNSKVAVKQFVEQDMELLASLASVASLKLRNIELLERDAQRRQIEAELALARRIQVSLLPETLPTFAGWSILGRNIPSRGVSGDYYVVVPRKDDAECVLFMADVSGKGIAASIVTASLEALAAAPIESGAPPDEICDQLCRRLYKRTPPEKYATAFCAVLEPATGRLTYTNAGHNTALLVHADGTIEDLTTCGLPIALLPEATYERRETRLEPGAGLLIYTDGITEAENKAGDEYGLDRLRDLLRQATSACRSPTSPRRSRTRWPSSSARSRSPTTAPCSLLQRVRDPPARPRDRGSRERPGSRPSSTLSTRRRSTSSSRAATRWRSACALPAPPTSRAASRRCASPPRWRGRSTGSISRATASPRSQRRARRCAPRSADPRRPRSAAARSSRGAARSSGRPAPWSTLLEGVGLVGVARPAAPHRAHAARGRDRGERRSETRPLPGRLDQELEPPGFEAILDAPAPALAAARPDRRQRPPRRRSPARRTGDRRGPATGRRAARPPRRPSPHRREPRPLPRSARSPATREEVASRAERRSTRPTASSSAPPTRSTRRECRSTDAEKALGRGTQAGGRRAARAGGGALAARRSAARARPRRQPRASDALRYPASTPPSTTMVWPVVQLPALDAR